MIKNYAVFFFQTKNYGTWSNFLAREGINFVIFYGLRYVCVCDFMVTKVTMVTD